MKKKLPPKAKPTKAKKKLKAQERTNKPRLGRGIQKNGCQDGTAF